MSKKEKLNYQLLTDSLSNLDTQSHSEIDIDEEILKLKALKNENAFIINKKKKRREPSTMVSLTFADIEEVISRMFSSRYDNDGIGKYVGVSNPELKEYFTMYLRKINYSLIKHNIPNVADVHTHPDNKAIVERSNGAHLDIVCLTKSKDTLRSILKNFMMRLFRMGRNDSRLLHKEDLIALMFELIQENHHRGAKIDSKTIYAFITQKIRVNIDKDGNALEESKLIDVTEYITNYTSWIKPNPVKEYDVYGVVKGVRF
jgi:hypothetical protein